MRGRYLKYVSKDKIILDHILEAMFGLSQVDSKEKLDKLIKELEQMPDFEIDFSKIKDEDEVRI